MITILGLLLAGSVAAQGSSDLGLKLGEKTRLHVGMDVGVGFDTNPNYTTMSSALVGDLVLAVRPSLKLEVPSELIGVEAGTRINFLNYFGIMDTRTSALRQLDGDAHLGIEVNRGGQFGFALRDRVTRSVDPGMASLGARLARLRNDFSTGVEWRPGGGLLNIALTYDLGLEFYDPKTAPSFLDDLGLYVSNNQIQDPGSFNNMEHKLKLRTEWRFLPKTGLFFDVYGSSFSYFDPTTSNLGTYPLGLDIGLMGQLTGKLSGVAKLGYNNPMVI